MEMIVTVPSGSKSSMRVEIYFGSYAAVLPAAASVRTIRHVIEDIEEDVCKLVLCDFIAAFRS